MNYSLIIHSSNKITIFMKKIIPELKPQTRNKEIKITNSIITSTEELHRKTLWIDFLLWTKINNYLQGQFTQGDFSYTSFSDFVRQTLTLYQKQELKISYCRITKRKQVGIKWNSEINEVYLALPFRKRTEIINGLLNSLLAKGK